MKVEIWSIYIRRNVANSKKLYELGDNRVRSGMNTPPVARFLTFGLWDILDPIVSGENEPEQTP